MRTVVVYESMYGNSHKVAERVGETLRAVGSVDVVPVSQATNELVASADLLVVGGPTHAHSLSSRKTRQTARQMAESDSGDGASLALDPENGEPGLRDWFKKLPKSNGQLAAAFDTRIDASALLTGRACNAIGRRLRRRGFQLAAEPVSFLVDKDTRLLDSESDRAAQWAQSLVAPVQSQITGS